jgi:two-component system, cell cycle sensor histidine kinase and response regulator CckA
MKLESPVFGPGRGEPSAQREELLHSILRVAPIGIGLVANRKLVAVNARICEMVGYAEEELVGKSARVLYPDDASFEYVGREKYRQIAIHGTGTVETEWRRKDGHVIDVLLSSTPLDPADPSKGVTFTALDITERKRAEEKRMDLEQQLIHAQKMEAIGRLAGSVAHDFNNLLTVIRSYADMSLLEVHDNDSLTHDLREIRLAADRAARLTKQLLAFSRRQIMRLETLDLDRVLEGMAPMLRPLVGENIEFELIRRPGLGMTLADPGQIEQVVMNLVVNARDAMPEGGRLCLQATDVEVTSDGAAESLGIAPGPYVVLEVSDTGCGMDEEIRARLFEPFFSTKEPGKGTGLGLATVYGIVKQSGGGIAVLSAPGQGATFRVFLPRVVGAALSTRSEACDSVSHRGNECILVAEDDAMVRGLVQRILTATGYRVIAATSGEDALRAFDAATKQGTRVDALLSDVVMPGMNGWELAGKLRGLCPQLRVVFMSGYSDDVLGPQRVLESGVRLINKPFTTAELERQIREALDAPSS